MLLFRCVKGNPLFDEAIDEVVRGFFFRTIVQKQASGFRTMYPAYCKYVEDMVLPNESGGICVDQTMTYTDEHGMPHQIPACTGDADCCAVEKCFCMKHPGARPTDTGVCASRETEEAKKKKKRKRDKHEWYEVVVPYSNGKIRWTGVAIDASVILLVLAAFYWMFFRRRSFRG